MADGSDQLARVRSGWTKAAAEAPVPAGSHRHRAGWTAGLALIFVMAGCGRPGQPEDVLTAEGIAMGTSYRVTVVADRGDVDSGRIRTAIERELDRIDRCMSAYRADSEISRFNLYDGTDWFGVSPETAQVVTAALQVSAETKGAFDATVGPLVDLWGFGPEKRPPGLPDAAEIDRARAVTGGDKLSARASPPALKKAVPGVRVDLAAIAKGFGVDRLAAAVEELGFQNYLVEIGGEVRARGRKPGGSPWRVGIEAPLDSERRVQETVTLSDLSLATSGDYRRFFEAEGRRFSHIIDPRTGYSADHALASVTVAAAECMRADALATALLVLGPEEGVAWARQENLAALFFVRSAEGFERVATPAFDALADERRRSAFSAAPAEPARPSTAAAGEASEKERAVARWRGMRFGLFIHWGPVSLRGTEIGWSRGAEVPKEEYDQLYAAFDPDAFDADEWARTARGAGAKYLVITSKHHDGFCLWDSAFTEYDIMAAPFARDVLGELSAACRRHEVEFGVYYSICDWHHPDYPLDSPGGRAAKAAHDMPRYFEYVCSQTSEIIEKYGPVSVFWFDGEWEEPWTRDHGDGLYELLMGLQPDLVINNRVGKGRSGTAGTSIQTELNAGDFDTPEQRIGAFSRSRAWETCMTLCRQWSWKSDDEMKSLAECVRTLLRVAGGDGNLLLNVGPMPDGRIEPRQSARLLEIGQWLRQYGRCVYGTRGGPFLPGRWGASTCRDNRIYLAVFEWPAEAGLKLPSIDAAVARATALTGGAASVERAGDGLLVRVEAGRRDPIATIVEIELDRPAFNLEPVPVSSFGKPAGPAKAAASNVFRDMAEYGPAMAVDGDEQTRWATDPGTRSAWIEIDFGTPSTIGGAWILEAYAGRIQKYAIECEDGGRWKALYTGAAVDSDRIVRFEPAAARRFRLNIIEASEGPTVFELQLFEP